MSSEDDTGEKNHQVIIKDIFHSTVPKLEPCAVRSPWHLMRSGLLRVKNRGTRVCSAMQGKEKSNCHGLA